MSQAMAAMSRSRNHSRHEMWSPGCGEMRGTQSRCASVELARRDRVADRDVALLPPRGHVEEDAARGDAVEERVDRAPGGAGRAQALHEGPPIVELAVERHVAERVDVGDGEAVVDEIEAVEDHVGA